MDKLEICQTEDTEIVLGSREVSSAFTSQSGVLMVLALGGKP